MIRRTLLVTIAGALLSLSPPATAQTTPKVGVVDDPCPAPTPVPAGVLSYLRAALDPALPQVERPVATFQAFAAATAEARRTDWAQLCYYRADNARLAARPAAERRIVYIGDSITELWSVADPAFFAAGRVNRGVSGQTTGQMLLRFKADVVALKPAVVHILGGGNDLAGNNGPEAIEDVHNNIDAMATLARAAGIRVVLASLTPAGARPGVAGTPDPARIAQIAALNRWIAAYARRTGATYVDYHAMLASPTDTLPAASNFDGIHINLPAYRRIEPASVSATEPGRR